MCVFRDITLLMMCTANILLRFTFPVCVFAYILYADKHNQFSGPLECGHFLVLKPLFGKI